MSTKLSARDLITIALLAVWVDVILELAYQLAGWKR